MILKKLCSPAAGYRYQADVGRKVMEIIMKSLKPRMLTAAIGIPSVLVVIILSELWPPLVRIVVGLASVLMVGEFLYAKKLLTFISL